MWLANESLLPNSTTTALMAATIFLIRQLWARSRRNPNVEAVIHHFEMAMAGLHSEPANSH
jgi:hypothetical protein